MIISALTCVAVVAVAAPAVAAGPENVPPDRVRDIVLDPDQAEEIAPRQWITWDESPELFARPTDDDFHQWVKVHFRLTEAAGVVWQGWSFLQPEGTYQRVTVPDGLLVEGVPYVLRARTRDRLGLESPRWSKPVQIVLDLSTWAR